MGPFKCPDCGVWWAGVEHRCRPGAFGTETSPAITGPIELRMNTTSCSCSFDATGLHRASTVTCPLHDVTVTYEFTV